MTGHFNTSHVSINPKTTQCLPRAAWISIHPMFLLIYYRNEASCPSVNFNTSHVSINPANALEIQTLETISIHPMFLLIFRTVLLLPVLLAISIHPMFLLIPEEEAPSSMEYDFNTSHVSINRDIKYKH